MHGRAGTSVSPRAQMCRRTMVAPGDQMRNIYIYIYIKLMWHIYGKIVLLFVFENEFLC